MDESFLDKLQKDMGPQEESSQEFEVTTASNSPKAKKKDNSSKEKGSSKKVKIKEEKSKESSEKPVERKESWFESEGELTVDVYQTDKDLVIQSAIAGVDPENMDIAIEKDRVDIRGVRKSTADQEADYFYKECYWGRFSKEIILPAEVDNSRAEASMNKGVLTIRMPKIEREKKRKISVKPK